MDKRDIPPPVYLAVESKLNIHQKQIRPKRTLFSAPSKDIAKYFHKFVHTRNFREVSGLNLLSNIFNFCWLTFGRKPGKDFRLQIFDFREFRQKNPQNLAGFSSSMIIQGSIMILFTIWTFDMSILIFDFWFSSLIFIQWNYNFGFWFLIFLFNYHSN